jgi:hypothetical protein
VQKKRYCDSFVGSREHKNKYKSRLFKDATGFPNLLAMMLLL